jgi:hypothetical protein
MRVKLYIKISHLFETKDHIVEGFQVSWLTELVLGRTGGRSRASVSVFVLVSSSTHVLGAYIYSIE